MTDVIVEKLGIEDVEPLRRGANLLGSGGGGDSHLSSLWLSAELDTGAEIRMTDVNGLDHGYVLGVGIFGSTASVAIEKLPAGDELRRCVSTAEKQLGHAIDAIGVIEVGGSNALIPFIAAVQTGKPVVDGDLMGRAFCRLDQTVMPVDEFIGTWVCAEAHGVAVVVDHVDARGAEHVMRGALTGLGGWAVLAFPPMSVENYRRVAMAGTVTEAIRLGRQHQDGVAEGDDGAALADRLGGDFLGLGTVLEVYRYAGTAFAGGSIAIRTGNRQQVLRIEMQNEYLMVLRDGEPVVTTPDVICLLDAHSLQPIQTGQVRRGHEVVVLTLPTQDRLWHPDVLPRVGPRAHGLDMDPVRMRRFPR